MSTPEADRISAQNVSGGDGEGRIAEIAEGLTNQTPEELEELARTHTDTDGTYRIGTWLEGKRELTDAEIEKLLPILPRMFYERQRRAIAKRLGVRMALVDQVRGRPESEDSGPGTSVNFDEPDPWPEPVDGGTLLDDIAGLFKKFIILPDGAAELLALWSVFTHLHDHFHVSPVLCLSSPEKRCGKTSTLAILGQIVARPLPSANMTAASVFRGIEAFHPCLLIDEADTFLQNYSGKSDNSELRGVLNSGHLRSQAYILRCCEPDFEVKLFSTWCPKAVALIGRLPPTLADRSIIVKLQRKRPDEQVERLRFDRLPQETEELRHKLVRWAQDVSVIIKDIEPPELAGLGDRAADNWRALLTIATIASSSFETSTWLDRAKKAALLLSGGEDDDELGSMLLADLQTLFVDRDVDRLSSGEVVEALAELEDRPWIEYRKGKPITKRQLAGILGKYGVAPQQFKVLGIKHRGYLLSQLEPLFMRYCGTGSDNSLQDKDIGGTGSVPGTASETVPHDGESKAVPNQYGTRYPSGTDQPELISLRDKEIIPEIPGVPDKNPPVQGEII